MIELTPEHIRATLDKINLEFPFPQREIDRTPKREWITAYAPRRAVGAEIGVFRGRFSEVLLRRLTPRRMYFIDPWRRIGETFNFVPWYTNENRLTTEAALEEAMLRAALYPATESIFIEDYFPACVTEVAEKLDWIYLDSSHLYDATVAELEGAERLLAAKGVIMGDDWMEDPADQFHGVFRAVNEFVKRGGFEFVAAGLGFQWCIRRSTRYAAPE